MVIMIIDKDMSFCIIYYVFYILLGNIDDNVYVTYLLFYLKIMISIKWKYLIISYMNPLNLA